MDDLVGKRTHDGLELEDAEELKIRVGIGRASALGARGAADGIVRGPATLDCMLEDRMQEGEEIAHRLGRQSRAKHGLGHGLCVAGRDLVKRPVAQARSD
ncbi:MAG: hypothetical protein M3370_05580, partial [Actinomycetota bacterium]|nr:hypothetical protein [Actinomycetota bacterium]